MNAYETSLEALTKNIKTAARRAKKDGTVAIGKRCLRQLTSTNGVSVHPSAFERLFDDALAAAKLPAGFVYE